MFGLVFWVLFGFGILVGMGVLSSVVVFGLMQRRILRGLTLLICLVWCVSGILVVWCCFSFLVV